MPIRPENRARYPADWPVISHRIRFVRGEGRCECVGECGLDHATETEDGRCPCRHAEPNPRTGAVVVLTCAHRPGREIEQVGDRDLLGACQQCHNRLDAPLRAATRRRTAEARRKAERARVLSTAAVMAFQHECATGRRIT